MISNAAKQLIERYNIDPDSVKPFNEPYVSIEAVLYHLTQNLPVTKEAHAHPIKDLDQKIHMKPKENCRIRPYQADVVNKVVCEHKLHPYLIVMPCGSGKTFVGCCIGAKVKGRMLIITNYKAVAKQWLREIEKNFSVPENNIQCVANSGFKCDHKNPPMITIITYDTLTSFGAYESRSTLRNIMMTDYTTIILDEAHKTVATSYFCMIVRLRGTFIALTATPVREDSEMQLLKQLVGDNVIDLETEPLIQQGYISRIMCTTIVVPMNEKLTDKRLSPQARRKAAVINPNKLKYLLQTLTDFKQTGHKTIVFCDDIWSMHYTFKKCKEIFTRAIGPISMHTSLSQREIDIENFISEDSSIIFMSRTGDEGIDTPNASAIIQICTPWGSRRQHAQRLGRIQRPCNTYNICCEAVTLVSDNTSEVKFSKRRDEYLRQQNYIVREFHDNSECKTDVNDIIAKITKPKPNSKNKKYIKKTKKRLLRLLLKRRVSK